jgi:hypothetical protein
LVPEFQVLRKVPAHIDGIQMSLTQGQLVKEAVFQVWIAVNTLQLEEQLMSKVIAALAPAFFCFVLFIYFSTFALNCAST